MLGPFGFLSLAEIASECLLAPLAIARVGDRRERGHGLVFARILQELFGGGGNQYDQQNAQYSLSHRRRRKCASHQSQSAVPAHTVPEDAHPLRIHLLEVVENGLGQLRGDVAVHFVSLIPGGFRRVDVEARAAAEIKGVVFALDFETT